MPAPSPSSPPSDGLGLTAESVLAAVPEPALVVDPDGRIRGANPAAQRVTGRPSAALPGVAVADVLPAALAACVLGALARPPGPAPETVLHAPLGRWFAVHASPQRAPDGGAGPTVVVLRDATAERTGVLDALRAVHEHDRRAVTERIADGLVVLDAHGTVTYANPAAARMLGAHRELAGTPVAAALYGGDARAAELAHLRTAPAAEDVFRRHDGSELHVAWSAASLGVGTGPDEGRHADRVVVFRDVAEHRARETRLRREADARGWAGRLRQALDEDRFVLHAQPIVATGSGTIVDHELLLRLPDDDGRLLLPGAFLPAAEELGAIVEIDRWVARQAVRCAAAGLRVHFNLSGQTIGDEALLDALRAELAETGADPHDLTVEVTETALLRNGAGAAAFVQRLRHLGCRVALDDFGTGYNGLGRVHEIPADAIKIDRRFVSDLLHQPASENVVKAILAFAGEMGLGVVAEGVEDEPTAERLRELGVPHAQGFHFGRPEPLAPAAPV